MCNGYAQTKNRIAKSTQLKILFFHNTLPEYRIGWFESLAKMADIEFVFTNVKQNERDYGFKIEYERASNLKCTFLSDGKEGVCELQRLVKDIEKYDFIELPPIDSIREVIYSAYIVYKCKQKKIRTGYFWEKWDAPRKVQPLGRRIKNLMLRIIPRMIYRQVDVIFSTGKKNRDYFVSNGVNESKIVWIPDVSETPKCEYVDLREMYRIPIESKVFLYLGRVMPQKGVRKLIEAYALLDSAIKKTSYLIIAGDGEDLENCKSLAKKLKIENISFVGRVNPANRGNYFAQCDVFIYPVTYYKGRIDVWGLTINEAIQHGKIVIATDAVGSAYELIENGINGFRVKPDDIEQLKNAMTMALNSKMARVAKEKDKNIRESFNFKNMAEVFINGIKK